MTFALPPDDLLYPHRVDIWRRDEANNEDGTRDTSTVPSRRARNVPCYFQTGDSVKAPAGEFIMDEQDNLFTYDVVRFADGVSVETGDTLVQVLGPEAGNYWTVRGDAKRRAQLGQYLTVRASRTPAADPAIAEAY